MGFFSIVLLVATFLCSLVAGFLFAFAVVVMPGIKNLEDGEFIRAFQVIDRVIQNNQPLFMLVWIGSVVTLVLTAALGFAELEGPRRLTLIVATFLYLFAVQLPTVTINVPLNNQLQKAHGKAHGKALDALDQQATRAAFEPRWNLSNTIRTTFASLVSILLLTLLLLQ